MMTQNVLDQDQVGSTSARRRDLLPIWIKVFIWVFLVFGAFIPVVLLLGITGMNFRMSLYGLETFQPISILGIFISILFTIKGIVAFGLWTEKKWAINLSIADAIIGIVVCLFVMFLIPLIDENDGLDLNVRVELIVLIPYLIKMRKIKLEWMSM